MPQEILMKEIFDNNNGCYHDWSNYPLKIVLSGTRVEFVNDNSYLSRKLEINENFHLKHCTQYINDLCQS